MNKGQSLIESVFAIAVVMLILSGVVVLLINTTGSRTKSFDRQTATFVAQTAMERLVDAKKNNPVGFWGRFESGDYTTETGNIEGDFIDYPYDIIYTQINRTDPTYPNCNQRAGVVDCVDIRIRVAWMRGGEFLTVRRFFAR